MMKKLMKFGIISFTVGFIIAAFGLATLPLNAVAEGVSLFFSVSGVIILIHGVAILMAVYANKLSQFYQ